MKKFNLAALPLAVAGILASSSAFAGTEACFEVYKGADALAATAFDTTYDLAACGARTGATNNTLAATDVVAIAYELTGVNPTDGTKVYDLSFDDIDATGALTGQDQVIVYIPTTDIPAGTLIDMQLTGSDAEFFGNGNQIHLVKDSDGAGAGTAFEAVASSDGTLDGTNKVKFITKAGVTIGAGTRLVFSKNSTGATDADFEPMGIKLGNTVCTDETRSTSVMLEVTSAVTDGGTGFSIAGARSAPQLIADISPQFYAFNGGTTAEALVNAESEDAAATAIIARTEFVYTPGDVTTQLVAKQHEVVYKTAFYNRAPVLDHAITLDADDHLETKFVASATPGAKVEMGLYNARLAATGVLAGQEVVETGTTWGAFGLTEAAATNYNTEALDVFPAEATGGDAEVNPAAAATTLFGATYNEMYYVVTNDQAPGAASTEIMNFNYVVDTHYTLDFGTTNELDHCAQEKKTHQIGVNGAVLKVPYTTTASGNFVRITNEHDEAAEVTFDMFGESADGTAANRKVTAISLGSIPAQSSVVYMVPTILEEAQAAGYLGADGGYAAGDLGSNFQSGDNRHTITFTVTAPRDSVHGVAVQKVIGSLADRVMPVLDQNDWSQ